jgi:hypothetical protein
MSKSSPRQQAMAREWGRIGARRRWARATAADRAKQGDILNDGKHKHFLREAQKIADSIGATPTQEELESSARALQLAQLAEARIAALKAAMQPEQWERAVRQTMADMAEK